MHFTTHIMAGILLGIVLVALFPLGQPLLFFAVLVLFSVFPDVDTTKSTLGKRVFIVGLLFRHRGIFHSMIAALFFSGLVFAVFWHAEPAIAAFAGYGCHLLLDAL